MDSKFNCFFKKAFIIVALLFSSSCVTKYLWGDKSYQERITQFLVGEDGRYVVMLGQYHYVFTDNSGLFAKILRLKQTDLLTVNADKTYIKLFGDNELKGYVTFDGPFNALPIEDIGMLTALGYRPDRNDLVSIKINLQGRRYTQKYLGAAAAVQSNNVFDVKINYNDSSAAKDIGKAAITPIAIGLDAVLLIGKIVVFPLTIAH